MNIERKEARHLLDVLVYLRRAVAIAQAGDFDVDGVKQLALERCIEIADEAFQRASPSAAGQIDPSLQLKLSKLRNEIGRDYHLVNPTALRSTVVQDFPQIIGKIEPLEDDIYRIAQLKRPPASGSV